MEHELYSIAKVAYQAYNTDNVIEPPIGFKMVSFMDIGDHDTQCYVLKRKNKLLIAFRGTQELGDFITDLNFGKTRFDALCSEGKIHKGFNLAYKDVQSKLHTLLYRYQPYITEVIFTGHSLGGALATIAAYDFKLKYGNRLNCRCITLGSPRVGNRVFAKHFDSIIDESTRVVNGGDPVTQFPTKWSLQYHHVAGKLRVGRTPWIAILRAILDLRCNGLLEYHKCRNYLENIRSMYDTENNRKY